MSTRIKEDLLSFVEEAATHSNDTDGIAKDLYDYVRELCAEQVEIAYLKGAKEAQKGFLIAVKA